ncbi:hypothetical protein [Rubinisphaera italica]|uniref:Uncharacterized protein n=1 Tax=Rubinisphaera italica TaxID=2527969 RepID=A0A5C5XBK0_9PLAN|nr:hypothetical protein [Rubinisphaera italica]TWT59791.1 hypothetical protein Pan54_05010 [Rubinisphaera italica]
MLNLRTIFQDAIDVLSGYESQLKIPAIPATVFLMQQDVVNHYRYAVTHYLPLTLDEHFLQNSSIGTPYEKWAKFTNEDFQKLSFTITNLIRYTTRLIHETESVAMKAQRRYREASARSNAYIAPLVEIDHRGRQVGIHVDTNQTLTVTPFSTETDYPGRVGMQSGTDGDTEWWHVTTDSDGNESKSIITKVEYQEITQTLRGRLIELQDRSVLEQLKDDGLKECDELNALTTQFATLCNSYCDNHQVAMAFDNLHENWWI